MYKEKNKMYKFENPITNMPWLDIRIEDECMKHLWNIINIPSQTENNKYPLAGNISKSVFINTTKEKRDE